MITDQFVTKFTQNKKKKMKTQKLLVIVASFCLGALFIAGPAYAETSLTEIILDFCAEVADDAVEAGNELEDAASDLADCPDEYNNCISGIFNHDTATCIVRSFNCIERAGEDGQQACGAFKEKFEENYSSALRRARRNGVEDQFMNWIENYGETCLAPAVVIAATCYSAN